MSRTRVSPSLVVALLALVVALSGTAYAAAKLPKNSVGSKQIKTNAVKTAEVKNNSLTGGDIKESTLVLPRVAGSATIAGTSFRPRASSVSMTPIGPAGSVWMSGGSDFLVADVVVPGGARITNGQAFILDQSLDNAFIQLVAIEPSADTVTILRSGTTVGVSPTRQVLDLTPVGAAAVVDSDLTYQLWYKPVGANANTLQVSGARFSWS